MSINRLFRTAIIGLTVIWVLGLAGPGPAAADLSDIQKRLTERVNAYWGYKLKKDFKNSYAYECPEYRKEVDLPKYLQSFGPGVQWLGFEIGRMEIEEDRAKVWVKVRYRWSMAPVKVKEGITSTTMESWKLIDGTWYHDKKNTKALLKPNKESLKGGDG